MGSWTVGDNALAVVILVFAVVLLVVLVCYASYEYMKRHKSLSADGDDNEESAMCDTNKEVVVYHQGVPITLRLIQTPSGMYCRVLDECQEVLLADKAETVAVIDRADHLCIGSADFDRCYALVLSKFTHAESLRAMSFPFTVVTMTGTATAEPYAEATLNGDGQLIVYSRNRRRTAMLSVEWYLASSGQRTVDRDSTWELFGHIFDTNGCLKYDLKVSTDKAKKGHSYALFHAYDKRSPSKSESPFLRIKGKPQMAAWAASQTGMSKTALVFKVYAKAVDGDRKIQIATIEPAIDGGGGSGGGSSGNGSGVPSTDSGGSGRGSITSVAFTNTVGDQLYSVKYKSQIVDPETKSAILGVAFLLCLRHCMKGLYRTFERIALSK